MKRLIGLVAALSAFAAGAAFAQPAYPNRTVTVVVPLSAGGGSDILARKLAKSLSDLWGQSVVVENVPGGSSIIGAQRVAKANPDGYTLMVTTNGTIVANRYLFKTLPYDPDKDLVPVTQLADIDMILLAHASLPANNLKELVALAKKEPGRISYGSYGNGSQPHLLLELFNSREDIQLLHVPYKGLGPALTSVMAGETQLTLTGRGTGEPAIRSGKTKVLTYMSDKRDPSLPDVPTSAESGYPYFRVATWHGLFAPKGTPKELVAKIHRDVVAVMGKPEFREDMVKRGYATPTLSSEEFAALIAEEVKKTGEMVKAAKLQPE